MPRPRELPVPHYEQEAYHYCGPAQLKMFLRCYGLRFSQTQLARMSGTTKANGTTARGMKRVMRTVGITYRTRVHVTLRTIERALAGRKPTIIAYTEPHDNEGHFAIPVRISRRYIWLRDSWNSQRRKDKKSFRLTREDFYRRWTNHNRWILIPRHAPQGW